MLSDHIISDFIIRFSDDFFYDDVKKKFQDYFDENNGIFRSITDSFNATIIGTNILGYDSQSTSPQGHHKGQVRTFQNSLTNIQKHKKTLDVSFALKYGLFNYYMLFENIIQFNENNINDGMDIFLPPIIMDIIDSNGNIIYTYIYKEIQVESLSTLSLKKTDNGIGSKEFTCSFRYNILDIKTYLNKDKSKSLNDSFKHKFK